MKTNNEIMLPNHFQIKGNLRKKLFGGDTEKIIDEINRELAA